VHDDDAPPQSDSFEMPSPDPLATANSSGRAVAVGLDEVNPDFLAEWEAMDPEEYAASLRDIPDHILDAAPPDLPEEIWRALKAQDEARMPDPLADPGGPVLAAALAGVVDDEIGAAGLIDRITGFDRQASWAAAGQVRAVAELAGRRVAERGESELAFVVDELALALTCTRYAAWSKLHTALDLVDRLPATLTAMAAGRICAAQARVIAEGTRVLTDADAARVQDQVLGPAQVLTPAKLRDLVTRAVAAVDPRDADEKHEEACASRMVGKYPREHGMTGIWALLPADHAAAVWAAVNTHAETSRQPGDGRTAEQRRADSLTGLATAYLDGTCPADNTATDSRSGCDSPGGQHRPPRVPSWCRVQVKVSADWLLGHSTEAPVLTGHGPLPADVALRLIADAGWKRIVYQPLTGALLDVGTTVHDPPAALREHILVRDAGCTQPICSNPRVDLDHNTPFPHGPTSAANLRSRCRHHHHLKQHPAWQARVGQGGRIEWISPTGHAYPEHQPDLRPGPTSFPRPGPHIGPGIGPDPPRDKGPRDDLDDPPPF